MVVEFLPARHRRQVAVEEGRFLLLLRACGVELLHS